MTSTSTTFDVADVAAASQQLKSERSRERLARLLTNTRILTGTGFDRQVVHEADYHPLIAAAALAFKHHLPLTLSPDMIWLTVLQGVAQHIRLHAESLRDELVPGLRSRIELVVDYGAWGLPSTDEEMERATSEFKQAIGRHLNPRAKELLSAEFSTTSQLNRIASAVALMDAYQPYFDYVFYCICGIPSVTLEGTLDDWELLSEKIEALDKSALKLGWWMKHLKPLCGQFVQAARGIVDREHWQDLIKITEIYGAEDLNGWLLKFIPYVSKEKNCPFDEQNPVLGLADYNVSKRDPHSITGCISNWLPSGLCQAPVKIVNRATGKTNLSDFVAGFTGVRQSDIDYGLRPDVGWTITSGSRIDQLIHRLERGGHTRPPEDCDLLRVFNPLPSDVWRFYQQTAGAEITRGETTFDVYRPDVVQSVVGAGDYEKVTRERRMELLHYSHCVQFAEARNTDGGVTARFVLGEEPEREDNFAADPIERLKILRWDGTLTAQGFTVVADNFSDWIEALLADMGSTV